MTELTEIQAIYKATGAFFAELVPKSLAERETWPESGREEERRFHAFVYLISEEYIDRGDMLNVRHKYPVFERLQYHAEGENIFNFLSTHQNFTKTSFCLIYIRTGTCIEKLFMAGTV